MNHNEFIEKFRNNDIGIDINKIKAGDLVSSRFANKYNKPAHFFWTWTANILVFVLPIILIIFFSWKWAVISVILGLMLANSNMNSAKQFVIENMLEDETFFDFVLYQREVKVRILDKKMNVLEESGKNQKSRTV